MIRHALVLLLALEVSVDAVQARFFDSNGVRIHFVDRGAGEPVIFIHGYTGNLERHWGATGVLAELSKQHRVIALDCRGHGQSDKPVTPDAYGTEMAQDVVRLMDHLKIDRAHIVGFSMGGMITAHLLTTHPERFLTASLVASSPVRQWTALDEEEAEAAATELEHGVPFRSLILRLTPADGPTPSEAAVRALSQEMVARNDPRALAAFLRGYRGMLVSDGQLAAVRVPTVAIVGSVDAEHARLEALTSVMPSLKMIVVEGATHGGERSVLRRRELLHALDAFMRTGR